jgi:hypothetical protein
VSFHISIVPGPVPMAVRIIQPSEIPAV